MNKFDHHCLPHSEWKPFITGFRFLCWDNISITNIYLSIWHVCQPQHQHLNWCNSRYLADSYPMGSRWWSRVYFTKVLYLCQNCVNKTRDEPPSSSWRNGLYRRVYIGDAAPRCTLRNRRHSATRRMFQKYSWRGSRRFVEEMDCIDI